MPGAAGAPEDCVPVSEVSGGPSGGGALAPAPQTLEKAPQLLCSRLLCLPVVRATWELVKNTNSGVRSAGSEGEAPGRLVGTLGPPRPYLQGGPLQHLPGDGQLSSRVLLARRPIPRLDSEASTSP